MSGVNDIRKSFLDFFARNDHTVAASSPLVPRNDPTLMFTNAGMVQYKNVFTALEKLPFSRAVTAQKCVRAGGKHNDLDNVGYTARHHTFFEMLGNFSFGDYFKERAIELAWRLVTKDFGISPDRLLVTVYVDDDDAFKLWKKISGFPDSKNLRIAGGVQNVQDNYDIDLFRALIQVIADLTKVSSAGQHKASHRVIADHLRASAFLIADGVLPSNEGRGYVLRRIMRRAMRHAELLGAKEPLMWKLVPTLTREMSQAYPELLRAEALIGETLKLEETRFRKTLERGLAILDEKSAGLKKGDMFEGGTAFTLYDTYGFPLDLTQDALRPRGISVDIASFNDAMERQREKARASWVGSGEAATETLWFSLREKVGSTEFLGYETESAEGVVAALVKGGREVSELKKGESGAVVMNQTPFYGESGGQVGDTGEMRRDGAHATVIDTQKKAGDLFVHAVKVEQGTIRIGDPLLLEVDHARRTAIRQKHSATHLLHEALRQVLGDHVAQKGSLVAPDRLRFDFSHPKPITPAELERVEDIANDIVLQNAPVTTRLMALEDARASGARALFGEKYGDEVRVVAMGDGRGT